ncbi:MAG TPA: TadE family protein [Gaiellaceae bacterium]|nr:TadE family protein [Gaiellaceae bacterium]
MTRRIHIGNQRGQTMTEFALVMPILLFLLLGIIQFGIVFNNYVTLTDAVRAGARKGAVARRLPNPSGAVQTQVRNSATDLNQKNLSVTVTSTFAAGSDVTVTATYPYSISLLGLVVKSGSLHSTTTERVE